MNKIILKYIYFIFFIFESLIVTSQNSNLRFERFGLDDGLSQLTVNCIYQDSEGFIWLGTQSGLNKYSGISTKPFKVYSNKILDKNSLSDNWINAITEDTHNNIWIGTRAGLNKLDKKTNKITRYLSDPTDPNSLSNNNILGLYVDKKGFIWIKTPKDLNKLDTRTGKFYIYENNYDYFNESKSENPLPIISDSLGNLWIGSNQGLQYFDVGFEQPKTYDTQNSNISDNNVNAIVRDKKGNLWVGTNNGLNYYITKTKTFIKYFHDNEKNSISNNYITSLLLDHKGNLWIGTYNGGLNKFDFKENKIYTYKNDPMSSESLSHNVILSLYQDRSKILWVGTYGGGLDKIDIKKKKFKSMTTSNGLSYKEIAGLFIDNDSLFYVGYWGAGMDVINLKTKDKFNYSSQNRINKFRLKNDYVHVIKKLSDGYIWLGTRSGLELLDQKTGFIYDVSDIYKDIIVNNRVTAIAEDYNHTVWIGTEKGVITYNLLTKQLNTFYHNSKDSLSISENFVYAIIVDDKNRVWIGTKNGLNIYNQETNSFIKFFSDVNNPYSLSNNTVYALHQDYYGNIWVATGSGLNKTTYKSKRFITYTTNNGMPSNLIYAILEDNNHNIWVSTGYGLAKINDIVEKIYSYTKDDGLVSLEFNHGSYFRNHDGTLYFGGTEGINYFFPDSMKKNYNIPNMVFTKFKYRNNKREVSKYIENGQTINLTYKDHNIYIEFAALEFTNPKKNSYRYKLDKNNENDKWENLGNTNSISFYNLTYGTHKIYIEGSNNDRVWNKKPLELTIIVNPPFWRTIYAYISYFVIAFIIIFWYIKSKSKKLRKAQQLLRIKQLASLEIQKQKKELEVKNKSIFDSINYAQRIQQAIMPSEYLLKKLLPESFIFYKPKDIVSGDFYWVAEKEDKIFIAAVDCTGHGVPGAFMSIIGFDLLRNITKEQGVNNPSEILNRLNKGVSDTFSKNADENDVKDGMDLALIVIDRNSRELTFAGAMNPLYLVRNNKLIIIKGNRFSVGKASIDENQNFDEHKVKLQKGDVIYIFSDGYADQFGGQFGKKYKFRRFKHLLLTIHKLSPKKQKEFLDDNLKSWKGELEQVDDILIIGIKI